jgi:DNA-binding MarR family transcriptional regulator
MTRPPILTSRSIGIAENALRAVLTRTLIGTGLTYHRWVAMKLVADSPSAVPVASLVERLTSLLKLDEAAALVAIDDLHAMDLIDRTQHKVSITLRGMSLHRRLCEETGELSQRIYAGLDPDDLAATHRVLSIVTERANALLSEQQVDDRAGP